MKEVGAGAVAPGVSLGVGRAGQEELTAATLLVWQAPCCQGHSH